jgi:hypothetical protein
MIKLTVEASGPMIEDVVHVVRNLIKRLESGCTWGNAGDAVADCTFHVSDEDDAEEESCTVCGKPDSECQCEFCPNCDYVLESCVCDDEEAD